jgi:hypothetical protein
VASWWDENATWWKKTLFAAFKNAEIPRQMARASAGQRCSVYSSDDLANFWV